IASRRDDGVAMCLWSEEARAILAHIAALEARAKEAEAKVAAAEERGLVFNMLPGGRLDFCAIRAGSRLWDGRVRAAAAEAEAAGLREALKQIGVYGCGMINQPATMNGPKESWLQRRIGEYERTAREALDAARAQKEQKDD